MDHELKSKLIEEILNVPTTDTFKGRSVLLMGVHVGQRDEHDARVDVTLIIDQLARTSPDAIPRVIANAWAQVPGTDLELRLRALDTRVRASLPEVTLPPPRMTPVPQAGGPFHVPFPQNPRFVGRDEDLIRLRALLEKPNAPPVVLTGMGGVGKTQMAVEYAHRYRADHPSGVFWIDASRDWQAELARQAHRAGLRPGEGTDPERRVRLAHELVAYLAAHRDALVVFDYVSDPRLLRRQAPDFIPSELGCRILVTTRRRDQASPFPSLDVGGLSPEASLHLLLGGDQRRPLLDATEDPELAAAKDVCRLLGYLPLAITLAASFLDRHPDITLSSYASRLASEGGLSVVDDAGADPLDLATLHDAAMAATLRSSWEALPGPDARLVLQTAALLGESVPVPRGRLSLLSGVASAAGAGHASPLDDALSALDGLSLLDKRTPDEIRLHPLVREFAEKTTGGRDAFAAACAERLCDALWDMGRLHDEVARRKVDAILKDMEVATRLASSDVGARIGRLMRPLDREAHRLREWDAVKEPAFFLQQLRNRCLDQGGGGVDALAEAELERRGWHFLRRRFPTCRDSEALVRTLDGHSHVVHGVAATADGRFVLSASEDKTLRVWDLGTGQPLRALRGHTAGVLAAALTPNGRLAVSASSDRTLRVWDLETGRLLHTLEGHTDSVLGVAVTANGTLAVSASADATLRVWCLSTGRLLRTLEGHAAGVLGVTVSPAGQLAISASRDNTLKVWNLATGALVRTLVGHTDAVVDVAVTRNGREAISASDDKTLKVWKLATGALVRTRELKTSGALTAVSASSDAPFAFSASTGGGLRVWHTGTGNPDRTLAGHTDRVTGVTVTADGRFAVSASADRTLKVWGLRMGRSLRSSIEGQIRVMARVAVTADGGRAVFASWDKTLKVWDLATGQPVLVLEGHRAAVADVALTMDGRRAVSGSADKTIKVWDLESGRTIHTLAGHEDSVNGVAVTEDGGLVVSASDDRTLKVWIPGADEAVHTLQGHGGAVRAVAVTPDGRLAISASDDRNLIVWDPATGEAIHLLQGHECVVSAVAMTADGLAVSASGDRTMIVWDPVTGEHIHYLRGHTAAVRAVSVTPDGRFAFSASEDKTVRAWDLSTGRAIATLAVDAALLCCAAAPDGRTLVASDTAGSVHILDLRRVEPRVEQWATASA